jgi:hypothetical protein
VFKYAKPTPFMTLEIAFFKPYTAAAAAAATAVI